jgi:chromosome partitioning protein
VNRRMNPQLRVSGIVLTMFDSQTKLTTEVVAELDRFIEEAHGKALPWAEARIFASRIRRNIKLAESPSFGKPIVEYDPQSNGAADYRALAREVESMYATAPEAVEEQPEPPRPQVTVVIDRAVTSHISQSTPVGGVVS